MSNNSFSELLENENSRISVMGFEEHYDDDSECTGSESDSDSDEVYLKTSDFKFSKKMLQASKLALKPKKTNKKPLKYYLDLSIDTEFKGNSAISLQMRIKGNINEINYDFIIMVLDNQFKSFLSEEALDNYLANKTIYFFFDSLEKNKTENMIIKYLEKVFFENFNIIISDLTLKIRLWLYYSPTDLNIGFGKEIMRRFYLGLNAHIAQRISLSGKLVFKQLPKTSFYIKDKYGLDKYGLDKYGKCLWL